MQIEEIKRRLTLTEDELDQSLFIQFEELEVNDRYLKVYLTKWLKKQARKSKTWKSKEFCITSLKC